MSDTDDDGMIRADRAYLAGRRAAWADDNGRHRPVCDLSGLEALWWRRGYSAVRRQMRDGREIGRLLNYAEKKRQWAVAWRKAARWALQRRRAAERSL